MKSLFTLLALSCLFFACEKEEAAPFESTSRTTTAVERHPVTEGEGIEDILEEVRTDLEGGFIELVAVTNDEPQNAGSEVRPITDTDLDAFLTRIRRRAERDCLPYFSLAVDRSAQEVIVLMATPGC